jgi:hypothetical protein
VFTAVVDQPLKHSGDLHGLVVKCLTKFAPYQTHFPAQMNLRSQFSAGAFGNQQKLDELPGRISLESLGNV